MSFIHQDPSESTNEGQGPPTIIRAWVGHQPGCPQTHKKPQQGWYTTKSQNIYKNVKIGTAKKLKQLGCGDECTITIPTERWFEQKVIARYQEMQKGPAVIFDTQPNPLEELIDIDMCMEEENEGESMEYDFGGLDSSKHNPITISSTTNDQTQEGLNLGYDTQTPTDTQPDQKIEQQIYQSTMRSEGKQTALYERIERMEQANNKMAMRLETLGSALSKDT
jgi:hypothetical protein